VFEEAPPKAIKDKGTVKTAKDKSSSKIHYFNSVNELFAEKSARLKSPHNTARAYFRDNIL
jgi:hypothetical protein